ncbi:hypothetical protein ABIH81_19205 [Micromonospora sp. HUAS YX12]|uniref:Uncharacterized protein n=1 Tax=Micromonospora sp. HUAS YX12 TaxID=3156396 RepID=A0AAU7QV19_9ACTN
MAVNALPHKATRQHFPAPARKSGDAVIEIAVIAAHTGAALLDTLVNPGMPIQPGAQAIHASPATTLPTRRGEPRWSCG